MKKTQIIELFENIKSTKVSFFSIMMFVALGIAFFTGITWSSDGIQLAAYNDMESAQMHDIEISFPYGFTEEDVDAISKLEGVDEIEGFRSICQFLKIDGANNQIRFNQVGKDINRFVEVDGEIPDAADEIAVEQTYANKHDIKVGDILTFTCDDGDEMKYLKTNKYRVTATVVSPLYIGKAAATYGSSSNSIAIDGQMFVSNKAFKKKAFNGYTSLCIRSDSLRGLNSFNEEYDEAVKAFEASIATDVADITAARYASIYGDLEDEIFELDDKLREAIDKIRNGEYDIAEARSELSKARKDVAAGSRKIKASEKKYRTGKKHLTKANKLINQLKQIDFANLKESDLQILPEEIRTMLEVDTPDYQMIQMMMAGYIEKCSDAKAELKKELKKAKGKISKGKRELKKAKSLIASGERSIKKNQRKIVDAKKKYKEGVEASDELKEALAELKEYDCTISPRTYNGGVGALDIIGDSFYKMRFSMAALFLIVGLLVCYSAVSRIVYDQTTRIGTKKALGLTNKEITLSYLAYSGVSVLVGGVLACIVSVFVIEPIMHEGVRGSYILGEIRKYFTLELTLFAVLGELVLILICTWIACRSVLKRDAITLLSGENEAVGKHRFFETWRAWQKLPLLHKTIVNNCLNDKRRVFATIVGVAGCTALIVCAITMDDNIKKSFTKQYNDIFHFDSVAYFIEDEEDKTDSKLEIQKFLSDKDIDSTAIYSSITGVLMPDGKKMFTHVFVPMQDNIDDFITIIPNGDAKLDPGREIWMNISYANTFDAKAGDTVSLVDLEGQTRDIEVNGFFEYYLTRHQLIISPEKYEEIYDEMPEVNSILFDSNGVDRTELEEKLSEIDGFVSLNRYRENSEEFFNSFTGVSGLLVAIYLVMSIAMALLVLLNLFTMFVDEKKKEVITMMINGFDLKQVRAYLNRDAIVMTIVGVIIGLGIGTVMGGASVHSFEASVAYFLKTLDWKACGIAAASGSALSFLMMKIALRKVGRFELSDINKA